MLRYPVDAWKRGGIRGRFTLAFSKQAIGQSDRYHISTARNHLGDVLITRYPKSDIEIFEEYQITAVEPRAMVRRSLK